MSWIKLLTYISGSVDQELLLRNEYLVAENRILRGQITGRLQLNDGERKTLAEIGKKPWEKSLRGSSPYRQARDHSRLEQKTDRQEVRWFQETAPSGEAAG